MEMTIVTLTLTTVVSLLALLVGGMIGWMARQHSYETTPQVVYTHPEMFDAYGHIPKPQARKIKNYLASIIEDAVRYSNDRKPGRKKKTSK